MADVVYDRFLSGVYEAQYQMTGLQPLAGPYVILVSGTYAPDQTSDNTYADVTAHECTYGNAIYLKGGYPLTGATSTVGVNGSKTGVWDAQNVTWYNSTITNASGAVIYYSGGSADANKPLVAFIDFVTLKSSSAGDFTITWNAAGILHLRQG